MFPLRRFGKNSQNAQQIFTVTARHFSNQSPKTPIPSSTHYDNLVNAAGRERNFAAVRDLIVKRTKEGCFNTTKTFRFIAADVSILDELLQNLADLDDWFTRKHAHDALVAELARLHRIPEALSVAEIMVRKKYGATAVSFHPIINALARKKAMSTAQRVLEVMSVSNIRPDMTAYNFILTAHCHRGDVTSAAYVLNKMEEEGMTADARTYDALVLGACRAGKVEGALEVMRRMAADGLPALHSTYLHVIKELLRRRCFAEALEFARIYGGMDRKLDEENFGFLATRLTAMKRYDEVKLVVEEMQRLGLPIAKCD